MKGLMAMPVALLLLAGCGSSEDSFSGADTSAPTTAAGETTAAETVEDPTTTEGPGKGIGLKDATADVTDVKIVRTEDEYFPTIDVVATITNNSEKRSDYFVTVAIESADGATRYEESFLSVDGLEPGQTTTTETMVFDEDLPADAVAVVKEVQRTASV